MTFLYGAWYSIVLLRSKNKAKLPTQSAEKWICMGKWELEILAELFFKNRKTSDDRIFPPVGTLPNCWKKKKSTRKLHKEQSTNSYTISKIFNFCKNNYNLVVNTHSWAWSNLNIFASFGSLRTNDGALELSHQGDEFVFLPSRRG